jgi:hypothetical protein
VRKLASIQKILSIEPIVDKQKIELSRLLGWAVIVGKDEFKVGDLCVYCEPDTLLPEKPEFEFLRKRCFSKKYGGFRIRCMKMGGIYSQGIIFPLEILGNMQKKVKEGQDVSEILGVKAYDPEELRGTPRKKTKFFWFRRFLIRLGFKSFDKKAQRWPKFAIKSDETRLGAIPEILEHIKGEEIIISEKIDGQSMLAFHYNGKFGVCSRNVWLVKGRTGGYDSGQYWEMAVKYDLEKKLKRLGRNIGIQGEIAGVGVQGNKLNLPDKRFYAYQIQDLDKGTFLNWDDFDVLCNILELTTVPYITLGVFDKTVDEWTKFSVRKSLINPEVWAEGIVVRTTKEKFVPSLMTVKNRCSFKVVNPEFILTYE